jgi:diketogulonate reductase-like aldo/keto reductase
MIPSFNYTFMYKSISLSNGNKIPLSGFGTWKLFEPELSPAIHEAIKVGYRHFDGAAIYENEKELGKVFNSIVNDQKLVSREDVNLSSYYRN